MSGCRSVLKTPYVILEQGFKYILAKQHRASKQCIYELFVKPDYATICKSKLFPPVVIKLYSRLLSVVVHVTNSDVNDYTIALRGYDSQTMTFFCSVI